MDKLFDKILDKRNIYAAAYALPGYLKEKGLISAVEKDDLKIYNHLLYHPYCIDDSIIEKCRKKLEAILTSDNNELFSIRIFFKFKKINEDGISEYRPIHTTDIKTLICLQSIANVIFFNDDFEKGKRSFSSLNALIPPNYWGNIITKKPEYLYENWSRKYRDYVKASMEKNAKYSENKLYSYEAYLDLVNCFPNINTFVLYNSILHRLEGMYKQDELERVLQLLLYFKIGQRLNETERMVYYGTCVGESPVYYSKGLPQGLPHCFFLANLYLLNIKKIIEQNIDCDIDYYVDDMTLFCNLNHKDLLTKVHVINGIINQNLNSYKYSPIDRIENFYNENHIHFITALHEDYKKCSSIRISNKKRSINNMAVLARNTSGVGQVIEVNINTESKESTLSLVNCLLKAIKNELKTFKEDNPETALYRKRLESYYKFYAFRRDLISEDTQNDKDEDKDLIYKEKVEEWMDDGILQSSYHLIHTCRPFLSDKINELVSLFDLKKSGKNGIPSVNLYFTEECKHYSDYLHIIEPTTKYASLYNEAKDNISSWCKKRKSLKEVLSHLNKYVMSNCARSYIYNISSEFQRDYILAHLCVLLNIPINVPECYDTNGVNNLKWYELRIIHYLHQQNFNSNKFFDFTSKLLDDVDKGLYNSISDPLIFKVLPLFSKTVYGHKRNDLLILSHLYVQSMWKNGSKFLHFFTLHNVEHSVELIRQSFTISHTFSQYLLSSTDYFLLYLSCYFHDISLITYPDINSFNPKEKITFNNSDIRKKVIEAYIKVDAYFEDKIRSSHSKDSAKLLRNDSVFSFLDDSTRDLVANISESHGQDAEKVYVKQDNSANSIEKTMTRTHITHLKSIIRLADSLDMSQDRVSPFYLEKTFSLMPEVSGFHWISHLAINHCSLASKYMLENKRGVNNNNSYLAKENLKENVSLNVYFNTGLDIASEKECKEPCERVDPQRVKNGFTLILGKGNCKLVEQKACPLICKWMHCKNRYINEELIHIVDMNNKAENSDFTSEAIVNYVLDKNKTIVDKYINFLETYVNKKEIVTKEDFYKLLDKFEKQVGELSDFENVNYKIVQGSANYEEFSRYIHGDRNLNTLAEKLDKTSKLTWDACVSVYGEENFVTEFEYYKSQNEYSPKTAKDYYVWLEGFFKQIKFKHSSANKN